MPSRISARQSLTGAWCERRLGFLATNRRPRRAAGNPPLSARASDSNFKTARVKFQPLAPFTWKKPPINREPARSLASSNAVDRPPAWHRKERRAALAPLRHQRPRNQGGACQSGRLIGASQEPANLLAALMSRDGEWNSIIIGVERWEGA